MTMALEGKIKTPFGEMDKKWAIGGIVVAGGVVTVAYLRHKNSSANAATSGSGTSSSGTTDCNQTDPAGNVGCIDAQTGYVEGSPQDQAALQGTSGNTGVQDYSSGYGNSPYGYGGGYSGFPGGGAGGDCFDSGGNLIPCPGTGSSPTPTVSTKEEWVQQCISTLNADPGTFETLAAKIFAHLTVSTANKQAFMECVALTTEPPGGFPSPIKTKDTSSHPQNATVKVPKVTGERYEDAAKKISAAGLTPRRAESNVGVVTHQNPAANHEVKRGTAVVLSGKGTPLKKP